MVSVLPLNPRDRAFIIIGLVCVLVSIFLYYPVSADIQADEYMHCTGGFASVNSQSVTTGDNISKVWRAGDQYSETNAAQQYVTGPGNTEYDTSTAIGAGYSQTSVLAYSGGGSAWDTLYQGTVIPNESELACTAGDLSVTQSSSTGEMPLDQWVNGQIGVQGPNGVYRVGKVSSGTNYALSGDFTGRGAYYGDLSAASGAGSDKDSNEQTYGSRMNRHILGTSDLTGGIVAHTDWTSTDPRSIFNFTDANETENQTVSIPVNLSLNATEEA